MDFSLETERLKIRRFRRSDGKAFAEILTDPEVTYFEPYDVFTESAAIEEAAKLAENPEFFAVVLKENDRLVGKIYFHDCGQAQMWEVGWTFHGAFQGKGLANESVSAFLAETFRIMPVRKVIAEINGRNQKSARLAERLGMWHEACLRKYASYYKDADGNPIWDDMLIYGLFPEELIIK